jgi:hypothetical protein
MPLPYKEPSQVLYTLLGTIVDEGRRFAGAADLQVSDMSSNSPVGSTLAILERTLKVMSAVQARIHYAMKQEFILLRDIIRDYTPDTYSYEPAEGSPKAKKSDYDYVTVVPVSDPNAATMAQKVVQYQAVMQMAQGAPQLYDLPYLHRQMLEILGIKNAAKLVPMDTDEQKPVDPVSENINVFNGKPVKAFIQQDHDAHLTVHTSALQDPQIMQLMGQNPLAQGMMAAMQAHIMEHMGFKYRKQIEDAAGVAYPQPDAEMDANTEADISRLAAAAAKQVLQTNQNQAAQQQAQQVAQDPVVQMQQQELQIKAREVDVKEKKLMADAAAKADQLDIERERLAVQERIAGLQVGAKIATDKAQRDAQDKVEGLRIGVDIAREGAQRAHESEHKEADRTHQAGMQAMQLANQRAQQAQQAAQQSEEATEPSETTEETE